MTSFSDDVILQISNVKHKKGEGTLYIMNERIAFILENSEKVAVSHMYTDIKNQKISSEFKNKVQLQLVFHDGSTSTFQFTKSDRAEAVRDRDKVKQYLLEILPKFQKKINKELEEKNRILSENPTLLQLYRDLVITQVITPEEFWTEHASQYVSTSSSSSVDNNQQGVGVPADFLVNIKPQIDDCNAIKYNLTYETIQFIFKTYPAVKKKHLEYVPHKLSESEFWKKFFESHYFHKDRITSSGSGGVKDLFSECAKYDEQEFKKEIKSIDKRNSFVNLNKVHDIEEKNILNEELSASDNAANLNIIKRFNQHSMMVLKASKSAGFERSANFNNNNSKSVTDPDDEQNSIPNGNASIIVDSSKKSLIMDELLLFHSNNSDESSGKAIDDTFEKKLGNVVQYSINDQKTATGLKLNKESSLKEKIINEVQSWARKKNSTYPIHPAAAVNALGELTPGSAFMKNLSEANDKPLSLPVPTDVEEELQNMYLALGDLLRRFWTCFPPTTPSLEEKAEHTHDALKKFHAVKLKPFEDKIAIEHSELNRATSHLNQMLTSAYDKFASWQQFRRK